MQQFIACRTYDYNYLLVSYCCWLNFTLQAFYYSPTNIFHAFFSGLTINQSLRSSHKKIPGKYQTQNKGHFIIYQTRYP